MNIGLPILLKDSRGKPSMTHTLVIPAATALLAKFVLSGQDFGYGAIPTIGAQEFGIAFMAIIAPLIYRDKTDKDREAQTNDT